MPSLRLCVALVLLSCTNALGSLLTTKRAPVNPFRDADHIHDRLMASTARDKTMATGDVTAFNGVSVDSNAACGWDVKDGKCYASEEGMRDVLEGTSSKYSRLIGQFFVCSTTKDEEACNAASSCFWSKRYGFCKFIAGAKGFEDSAVVKGAPLSVEYYTDIILCNLLDEQSCQKKRECSWSQKQQICIVDRYSIFVGASGAEISAALQAVADQVLKEFASEFDIGSPSFETKSILDWKIPAAVCPPGSSKAACEFAQAIAASLLPVSYYCQLEYTGFYGFGGCISDPLCDLDFSTFACMQRRLQLNVGVGKAYEALSYSIEQPGDKKFVALLGKCLESATEDTCTGDCKWLERTADCDYRVASFFTVLAEQGERDLGPLCVFFAALASSGCPDTAKFEPCSGNPNCQWAEESGCTTRFIYMISTAFSKDPAAAKAYAVLASYCAKRTSSPDCGGARSSGDLVY